MNYKTQIRFGTCTLDGDFLTFQTDLSPKDLINVGSVVYKFVSTDGKTVYKVGKAEGASGMSSRINTYVQRANTKSDYYGQHESATSRFIVNAMQDKGIDQFEIWMIPCPEVSFTRFCLDRQEEITMQVSTARDYESNLSQYFTSIGHELIFSKQKK
jgi:hypothetical protein